MANDASKNVSQMVLKKFVPGFMDDRVLLETVDTQLLTGVINPNTGSSVQLKRPHQAKSVRTAGGDVSGAGNTSDIVSATVTVNTSNFITVLAEWSILEQAIELNQLEEILAPFRTEMITTYENELATFMINNAGLTSGSPAQAIDAWGDVASTGSYLKALGVSGEMFATMNPWAVQDLADTQSGLASGDNGLVNTAWQNAQISRNFGGLRAFMSDSLESYTSGDAVDTTLVVDSNPVVTYSALKDTYQMSIALAGLANGATLSAGQQIEFPGTLMLNQQNKNVLSRRNAGVPFIGTILADAVADGTGDVTVTISGAAIFDTNLPQYNTVDRAIVAADDVVILAAASTTFQPGLAYTKGFVGTGTVELPPLEGWDSSVVNVDGFSIRATKFSDPLTNVQMMRWDLLPAFGVFNPMMGMQFYGNA